MIVNFFKHNMNLSRIPILNGIILSKEGDIHYIGGNDVLPPPLDSDSEAEHIRKLIEEKDNDSRSKLIEHNLTGSIHSQEI